MFIASGRLSRPIVIFLVFLLCTISLYLLSSTPYFNSFKSNKPLTIPDSYYDWSQPADSSDNDVPNTRVSVGGVPAPDVPLLRRRANATMVMLARNSDLDGALHSVISAEHRFNSRYGYPWVFLNEEPFSEEFKRRISNVVSGPVEFGLIPREHWFQPDWIDEARAQETRRKMKENNIIYGDSLSYRNMCRFNSGFFYRHPLLEKYRFYWRVEPDVNFHCDVRFDPFLFMMDHRKVYGFTITLYEFRATIETLWSAVREFAHRYSSYIAQDNLLSFLSDDGGFTYNLCHFWSNFEIADMDALWRSEAYSAFFDYLDQKGGFYYERWGDAPVHSIAAALFVPRDSVHFFREIGYEHNPYTHCPREDDLWARGKCACDPARSFDYDGYSCMRKWEKAIGG